MLGVGLGQRATPASSTRRASARRATRARARGCSTTGLERLLAYWGGEFEPRPIQQPRIPIWVAARWPNRRPLRRAARFDGVFPIDLPSPDALAELVGELPGDGYEFVVTNPPGTDPEPWAPPVRRGA